MLYKSLVRARLEYANIIWSPLYQIDKNKIERVQRRATKCISSLKSKSYNERLSILKLPTLEYRRTRGDIIQTYKILKGIDKVKPNLLQLNPLSRTRGHAKRLLKQSCATKLRQNFFSCRVTNVWNSLPEEVIQASTLNDLKTKIDKCNQLPNKYQYKETKY